MLRVFLGLIFLNVAQMSTAHAQIAIVGDSACTGAVANPRLDIGTAYARIAKVFGGIVSDLAKGDVADITMGTLFPGILFTYPIDRKDIPFAEEFKLPWKLSTDSKNWILPLPERLLDRSTFERHYAEQGGNLVDTPEYSWGYFLGSLLGYKTSDIIITAEDGRQIDDAVKQIKRLKMRFHRHLPEKIFILFVANNVCDSGLFNDPNIEQQKRDSYQSYLSRVSEAMAEIQGGIAHHNGTDVYVLASLDFSKLLTTPDVLAKRVPWDFTFHDEQVSRDTISCLEMRQAKLPFANVWTTKKFSQNILMALRGMCRSVLETFLEPDGTLGAASRQKIDRLMGLHQTHIQAQEDAVKAATKSASSAMGIRFHFIPETFDMDFRGEDIANDCFHPSAQGHAHLAKIILRALPHH